ncbi:MAG TPA: hypothetical protein VIZ65_12135 [Cellvibrionaceae bacterium]
MMKKAEIIEVCIQTAAQFTGWEYSAGAFKNKEASPCIKVVHPFWSFSPGTALSQPAVGFQHKFLSALFKKLTNTEAYMLSFCDIAERPSKYSSGFRFYDIEADRAEEKIKTMLMDGIVALEKKYDFSSEKNLLENMPKHLEDTQGVCYCLVRAYLGDFDFVRAYRRDEIKITRGAKYYDWIDKIIEHFGIDM